MAGADGFLTSFKAGVDGNFARAYLFYATITRQPIGLTSLAKQKYLVRSTSMPQSTIEQIEVPFQGMLYKMASTSTFDTWECTFNADNDMKLRKYFVDWMKLVHDPKTNKHGSPENYYGEIQIDMLNPFQTFDNTSDPKIKYKSTLFQCWPSVVGAIDLAYDSKEIAQFPVTLTYGWHEEETIAGT